MSATPESTGNRAAIPSHIPGHLVYDYDYINDPQMLADPHGRMLDLARNAPRLFWTPRYGGHWVAVGNQVIYEIATDPERFSSASYGIPRAARKPVLIPLTLDPPEHTAYRMPLNRDFSVAGVASFGDMFRTMCDELIDRVIDNGGCDFLSDIAEPLPVTLFMTMAGMPTDRLAEFRKLAEDATAAPEAEERHRAIVSITGILSETIRARQQKRENDLISKLLDIELHGRRLTFDELQQYSVLLFLGGLETVVNALAFSVRYLAIHQDLQARLRADAGLYRDAVEELLRLHGIASTVRIATRDMMVGEAVVREGDQVLLHIPAANYDAAVYDNPEQYIAGRGQRILTFNTGPHRCLGANLARLELRIFLEQWLGRVPAFSLDPTAPAEFIGGLNLAVKKLPLVW